MRFFVRGDLNIAGSATLARYGSSEILGGSLELPVRLSPSCRHVPPENSVESEYTSGRASPAGDSPRLCPYNKLKIKEHYFAKQQEMGRAIHL
jgi:hypothetical protein